MADFLRKVLPDYTGEVLKPKYNNLLHRQIPNMVTLKHDSSNDDEIIDLQELDKTPQFQDRQYGIPKGWQYAYDR
jgi:hypothetical protein